MTLHHLEIFAAVARHKSITRASEDLLISQPALTQQLKRLEEECNAKLYKKAARGIELTEAGRIILRDVRTLLKQYDRLKKRFIRPTTASPAESLTVGGSYSPSVSLLTSLLAVYKKSHPHVQISLCTDRRDVIERMVLNSEVDIAVINNAPSSRSVAMEVYRQEPLVAFVPKNHRLARKRVTTWHEMEKIPLIIRKPYRGRGTAVQLLQNLKEIGVKPNVAMLCDSPETVKAAVKTKMGMGILFKETIEPEVKRGEFKIVKLPLKKIEGTSFIVSKKDRPLSAPAQDFLELLHKSRQKAALRAPIPPPF